MTYIFLTYSYHLLTISCSRMHFLLIHHVYISPETVIFVQNVMTLEESTCHISKPIVKSQAVTITDGTFVCENVNLHTARTKNVDNAKK